MELEQIVHKDQDVKEYQQLIRSATLRLSKQLQLTYWSLGIFLSSCTLTYLFTDKGPWHQYWSPFGMIFDVFSMISLLPTLYFVLLAQYAWKLQRDAKRDYKELLEDRYGATSL